MAAFQNQPPMWLDDRLRVEALLADALHEERHRNLALAEPGNANGGGEVVGGVLDRVVHVVRRHVDGQLDLVLGELLDLVRHQPGH